MIISVTVITKVKISTIETILTLETNANILTSPFRACLDRCSQYIAPTKCPVLIIYLLTYLLAYLLSA